jgi:hypothetical protein
MAVFAPMPKASDKTATVTNNGDLAKLRRAKLISRVRFIVFL